MLLQCNMHRFPCQIRYLIFFFGDTLYRYTYIFYIGVFSRNLYVFFPIRPIENILMLWITNYIMRYIICASHAYRSLILQVPPLLLFVLALICEVHPGVRKLHYSYSPPRVRKLHYSYFTQGWAINLDWGTNTLALRLCYLLGLTWNLQGNGDQTTTYVASPHRSAGQWRWWKQKSPATRYKAWPTSLCAETVIAKLMYAASKAIFAKSRLQVASNESLRDAIDQIQRQVRMSLWFPPKTFKQTLLPAQLNRRRKVLEEDRHIKLIKEQFCHIQEQFASDSNYIAPSLEHLELYQGYLLRLDEGLPAELEDGRTR